MLKLKRVQILGFKSFCDRTEVQFSGQGIAAIVGPNGCGKSNISDAILWVLGEQSAKSLRGLKMEDVIFAGTRDRKPMGMAEVSLTLVDPELYDGSNDQGSSPDLTITSKQATDWDEQSLREQNAAETEEAVEEAQPGRVLDGEEVDSPIRLAEAEEAGNHAANSAVVLKIRRRKFGRTPIRAGELTVTRRLFRSGDSEYLLNGKICRLRDIQDIFMGTGLGGESYAIIGQERIGQLLSAKPQDRRSIIEEAAGITRFKTKKRLAELRLESARQNLLRVNDIFYEVAKQMGTLKRQAAKAERYGQIRDELRTKLRVVLASRIAQLDEEQTAASAKIAELTVAVNAQSADVVTLDTEHSTNVRLGYTLDGQIGEYASTANQSAVELERIAARTQANRDRIAELSARLTLGTDELAGARAQLAVLAGEQESHRAFLDSASAEAGGARAAAQARQQAAQEAIRAVAEREQHTEQMRRASMQLIQRAGQARHEEAQATATLQNLEAEAARLLAESATAHKELQALGLERGQVKLSFESVQDRLKRLEIEISELRIAIEARRTDESQSKRRGDQLRGEVASLNGRRGSLEGLIRDHSYSTDTVKNIFRASSKRAQQTGGESAILGTLADFLEVDDTHGQLVDEFLREELNYILVGDWSAAEDSIRLLKSDVAGRATFLVAKLGREEGGTQATSADRESVISVEPGAEGALPLLQIIRINAPEASEDFAAAIHTLVPKLRESFIVSDSVTARSLALEHRQSYFLSLTGETFHGASVTGGRPSSGGPLVLKRELKEVETKLTALQQELGNTDHRTMQLQAELQKYSQQIEAGNQERREAEREAANSGAALRQMESETARIERRLQDWSLATDCNRDARNSKADLIAARQREGTQLEAERATLEAALITLLAEVDHLRLERETQQQLAAQAAAALAGLEERQRNAQANYEQTTRLLNNQGNRIAQLETQLEQAGTERQRREAETAELAAPQEQLAAARLTAVGEGARLTAEARDLREVTAALDLRLRALRTATEALKEERAGLSARLAKLSSDLEHLEQTCLNDLAIPALELREDRGILRIEGDALMGEEAEARGLKHRLESMGPVNMMAFEEYTETTERHAFLEAQRKDLLDSIANTSASLKEIDDVSRVKFDEAYKVINENFSVTFAKLFGGGQASMRLTDPDNANSDSSGIEILASPPGKKLQNILLLSGGEKALTALALLVGIFQFQPAPFCILDEVDAPLDETNVGRFARMISDLAQTTQFIAITHNKRTMAQADVIYGVTMQEPGVSKVVSVNLSQTSRSRERGSKAA